MVSEEIIKALAEQAYSFHLLVKSLRERGHLQPGEPISQWNESDFQEFLMDYRAHHFSE